MTKLQLAYRPRTEVSLGDDDCINIVQNSQDGEEMVITFDRKDADLIIEMINEVCAEYDETVTQD